jgi:methyl coenzyme M reductase alpha subunit
MKIDNPDSMTLRDWFAGQIMASLIVRSDNAANIISLAEKSYAAAHAMMTERKEYP